jgi:pilus assembly protein CpaF
VHANSPADALRRVETLALMAGVGLPHAAVREQATSAIDLVVHQARLADGSRVVDSVVEVAQANEGSEVKELYRRGGPLKQPAGGRLAARIALLRREGPS